MMVASLLVMLAPPTGGASNRRDLPHVSDVGGIGSLDSAELATVGEPNLSIVIGSNFLDNAVKKLIKKDKLHQLIDLLLDQSLNVVSELQKLNLLHQHGRIKRTKKEWKKNRISFEDYQKFRNIERFALLQLCEEILPTLVK